MKTVLPFRARPDRTEHALFYHGDDIKITLETRPVPQHWNSSETVNGVETPITEMEFIVLRFPKEWYNKIEQGTFSTSSIKIWNKLGAERELLLLPYALNGTVMSKLAKSGFFKFTERLSPLPSEGLYLPFYQTPVYFHQKLSNVIGVTLSIPQASWNMYQERKRIKALLESEVDGS